MRARSVAESTSRSASAVPGASSRTSHTSTVSAARRGTLAAGSHGVCVTLRTLAWRSDGLLDRSRARAGCTGTGAAARDGGDPVRDGPEPDQLLDDRGRAREHPGRLRRERRVAVMADLQLLP